MPVYVPTEPKRGGLRLPAPAPRSRLCTLKSMRPVKVLPIYRQYSQAARFGVKPGFEILSLLSYKDADVMVVDKLSDVDTCSSDSLARCSA